MNILFVTALFPTVYDPARGIFNLRRIEPLTRDCQVRVVSPVVWWRRLGQDRQPWRVRIEQQGALEASYVTVWTVPRLRLGIDAEAVYQSVRRQVRRLHRKAPIDGVIGSFAYPDVVAASKLARDIGCPFIALVVGSDINVLAHRRALRPQIAGALRRAELVVALSQPLRDQVLALGVTPDRAVVQHNGVDHARFRIRDRGESRRQLGLPDDGPVVAFVGNLAREKGPDVLIEAVARMVRRGVPVRAVLVGDGALRRSLELAVQLESIEGQVIFAGARAPEDIPLWMAAADVLCLPSRREGCPNAVLEALASGRPVVASAVGGVPELLNDSNGYMVASEDGAGLAAALTAALQREWDPEQLRSSVAHHSWDAFGELLRESFARAHRQRARLIS